MFVSIYFLCFFQFPCFRFFVDFFSFAYKIFNLNRFNFQLIINGNQHRVLRMKKLKYKLDLHFYINK